MRNVSFFMFCVSLLIAMSRSTILILKKLKGKNSEYLQLIINSLNVIHLELPVEKRRENWECCSSTRS